ncbi:hypothetical protein BC834DRAFT_418891 [Gloeopeniophorella convolvens]|nr:hypothetical protein BC834DRAFT_418891 [Gloeopeniophorella convolvens]
MHSQLLSLYPELLIKILSLLSPGDIISCQLTCRQFDAIVNDSVMLQYFKETTRNGVWDPLSEGPTFEERFEKLRQWEKRWWDPVIPKALTRVSILCKLDIFAHHRKPISLQSGTLVASTVRLSTGPGVYAQLDLSSLPNRRSRTGSVAFDHVTFLDETSKLTKFLLARECDLLIDTYQETHIVGNEQLPTDGALHIRLLSLSTLEDHPSAVNPHIIIPRAPGSVGFCLLEARLHGNHIVVMACDSADNSCPDEVFLVSWREGIYSRLRSSPFQTFFPEPILLSENLLIIVQRENPALELCSIALSGNGWKLETLCKLALPVLQRGAKCHWVEWGGDPLVDLATASRDLYQRAHHLPFIDDPSEAVFCFTLDLSSPLSENYSFFVQRSLLCEYAARGGGHRYPWPSWGPAATRWIRHWDGGDTDFRPDVPRGSRIPIVHVPDDKSVKGPVIIYDFHPKRVRSALTRGIAPSRPIRGHFKVVTEPSTLKRGDLFEQDVTTSLPYCEIRSKECYSYDTIVLDEERIVGSTVGDSWPKHASTISDLPFASLYDAVRSGHNHEPCPPRDLEASVLEYIHSSISCVSCNSPSIWKW